MAVIIINNEHFGITLSPASAKFFRSKKEKKKIQKYIFSCFLKIGIVQWKDHLAEVRTPGLETWLCHYLYYFGKNP